MDKKLNQLSRVITENLRVQRDGVKSVKYIDVSNVLVDVSARQNHAIFGRRGCGKTLLLHYSSAHSLPKEIKTIYLNCEDFKKHSFPNVLIEILDALFEELERNLVGWFGRKKKSRELIKEIRNNLRTLREHEDERTKEIRETETTSSGSSLETAIDATVSGVGAKAGGALDDQRRHEIEQVYKVSKEKIQMLDLLLPQLKRQIREFFELSSKVQAIYLQVDDFYHLVRADQPIVVDYIHRLCKDLPIYFKIATLKHASTLYIDRDGQPIGAQERHDYQPIDIDFTFSDLNRTIQQNKSIFHRFGELARLEPSEIEGLFKGEGFERLIIAGGGVPRDCLSLFLDVLKTVQPPKGDGRIGKDDVRIRSRSNFERRIEELKQDSDKNEQGALIKGIYIIRQFCIDRKTNVLLIPELVLQQEDRIRHLLYRLLDYRIIHSAGSALTHKSRSGTYRAFVIDIGCYAHMRVLKGKFNEIDLTDVKAKEKMRSAPIFDKDFFSKLWESAPEDIEEGLKQQDQA
jgi:hypothetical protein